MDTPLSDKKKNELKIQSERQNNNNNTEKEHLLNQMEPLAPHMSHNVEYEYEAPPTWRTITFDFFIWMLSMVFHCFFREIRTRGAFKIPNDGQPVIFVAAPHANQFVDPVILMDQVKRNLNRRVSFLIAESSMSITGVGFLARCLLAIGVVRPQDNLRFIPGKIKVDPANSTRIIGIDTHFLRDCEVKGLIGLPKSLGTAVVESIESDTCLTIRKEFKCHKPEAKALLQNGTSFKYAHKVDHSLVYNKVFEHLAHNGCLGIFPEGGSHDRTDLLPLKAGVAIMALGCMDKHPDVSVKIVPCGMNYFHPHKFRSRAVVEFGEPIEIPKELVHKYHNPETNKDAVKELLDTITKGLKSVTVTCQDYETLMVVHAMRRLYSSQFSGSLPLPMIMEMNRRIVNGYQLHKDDPQMKELTEDIMKYNAHLRHFNLPDHLVETAKVNFLKNFALLSFRLVRITISLILALPGLIMFSPVFILSTRISNNKRKKALANSTVKIKANDVIATWKILIAMGFAPLLYIFWSILITIYFRHYNTSKVLIFTLSYMGCVLVTYSALIVGDIGMDILKSIRPLYTSIRSPNGFKELQNERQALTVKIVNIVNQGNDGLFPGFTGDDGSLNKAIEEEMNNSSEDEEEQKTAEMKRRHLLRKRRARQQKKEEEEEEGETREIEGEIAEESDDVPLKAGRERTNSYDAHTESDGISLVNSDNSLSNIPLFSSMPRYRTDSNSSYLMEGHGSSSSEFELDNEKLNANDMTSRIAQAVLKKRTDNDCEY
ncbi:glycerol-3-phosphate O-acyltransferase 1 [Monosporozyma servazzii]